jgi:hypothetical protein
MEVLGTVDGVQIQADSMRGFWHTGDMVVWFEAGPRPSDPVPSLKVLAPLVRASLAVPYPPVLFGED